MRHFVFLQGPLSPFYCQLSKFIYREGHLCTRIAFNGGDAAFGGFWGETLPFNDKLSDWEEFFSELLTDQQVTDVVMYGDCRAYHRVARKVASAHGVSVWVFEEGYLRPNYITLEKNGVNANSSFVADDDIEVDDEMVLRELPNMMMLRRSIFSSKYYLRKAMASQQYPHYHHHRTGGACYEAWCWVVSYGLKPYWVLRDRLCFGLLKRKLKGLDVFFCPLQVHNDSQVLVHSSYVDVSSFITHVLSSFSESAPSNAALIIKHHPMDRGFACYQKQIDILTRHLGIRDRVYYGHEYRIPEVLRLAKGCVVINSTVGLSSLIHSVPVKLMGRSIYQTASGVFNGPLNQFWLTQGSVNVKDRDGFLNKLRSKTQISGSFYSCPKGMLEEICHQMIPTTGRDDWEK